MKKILCFLLTVALLFSFSAVLWSCAATPAVEDIYDRVVSLIEASYDLNTVFYGPGLPVIDAESEYAEINRVYYDFAQSDSYEFVTENAKFYSVEHIKEAAQKVYSKGFLEDVIYKTLFDGYAIEDGSGGVLYSVARYLENGTHFCMATDPKDVLFTAMRVYDYSSMQVLSLGRSDACRVVMDSWLENSPDKVEPVRISLVLQDGQWFLDSFTGA